jgi:hypothetical protein
MGVYNDSSGISRVVVLVPVFNDWEAVSLLLPVLDRELSASGLAASVLLIDDGSTSQPGAAMASLRLTAIHTVHVLPLRRNLGHQRAIAVGLTYVEQQLDCDAVVVMDGDGEDMPSDVPRLLHALETADLDRVIFAARSKRSEGVVFRVFYWLYRRFHLLITGIAVKVGNFSVVPRSALRRLVIVSELWNHYAAAVVRARIPYDTIPTRRALRLAGKPTMNFVALVSHGLSALAVHSERAGVRMLIVTLVAAGLAVCGIIVVVSVRLFSSLAIPGWATTAAGLTLVLMVQLIMLAGFFTMFTLGGRDTASFIPIRDYHYFVDGPPRLLVVRTNEATLRPAEPPRRTPSSQESERVQENGE